MDAEGITLSYENKPSKYIKWQDITRIIYSRHATVKSPYGAPTYIIWDCHGRQIWFLKGKKVKKYMLEVYPPIESLLPSDFSWEVSKADRPEYQHID